MSRIFWDTNLFIYLVEDTGALTQQVADIRRRMRARGDDLYTSWLTLGEVLVKPTELGREDLVAQYRQFIEGGATIVGCGARTAQHYAEILAVGQIRPPDAIQLACAASVNTDLFLTNDQRLARRVVNGVRFISTLEHSPL